MIGDWNIAKEYLIKHYFPDDAHMQEVAEKAYMGDWVKQEELAEWFEKNMLDDIAESWHLKAKQIRKDKGIEI